MNKIIKYLNLERQRLATAKSKTLLNLVRKALAACLEITKNDYHSYFKLAQISLLRNS